jgi:hypothetical protein
MMLTPKYLSMYLSTLACVCIGDKMRLHKTILVFMEEMIPVFDYMVGVFLVFYLIGGTEMIPVAD